MVALTYVLLPAGSSFLAPALLCTFGILQASWDASLAKARQKIVGVSAGMLAATVVTALVPEPCLVPIALVAVVLGMWFLMGLPSLAYFFLALMSVGLAVGSRGVDPGTYIAQYFTVVVAAVFVGVFLGFILVKDAPHPSLRASVDALWSSITRLLQALVDDGDRPVVLAGAYADFSSATQELLDEHAAASADDARAAEVGKFADLCFDIALCGVGSSLGERSALEQMAERMDAPDTAPLADDAPAVLRLVEEARALREALVASYSAAGTAKR